MICIPITAAGEREALGAIRKSATLAEFIELRMDLIRGGDLQTLLAECRRSSSAVRIMVTNRRRGETAQAVEKQRIALLEEAVLLGADGVDLELDTPAVLRERLRRAIRKQGNHTSLIISHHDFVGTPSGRVLQGLVRACIRAGADIVKIVTTARSSADNLNVLSLIPYGRSKGKEMIAFCMGEEGVISRIASPLLGGYLTFASLKRGAESAPGQIAAAQMRQIFRLLEGKEKRFSRFAQGIGK